jgi:site-specific recombinase XerD
MPVHEEARELIRVYLKAFPASGDAPLFRSTGTADKPVGRLEYSVFWRALKKALTRASIQDKHLVSTHSMRKTFASEMNEAVEGNIYKLQKLMGHKDISSTARYVAVNEKELFELVKNRK